MASHSTMLRRRFRALQRNLRGVRMVVRAFLGTDHPLLAHIIPVRRCNLACKYCNEFDDFSKPVPVETMFRRGRRSTESAGRVDNWQARHRAWLQLDRGDHSRWRGTITAPR